MERRNQTYKFILDENQKHQAFLNILSLHSEFVAIVGYLERSMLLPGTNTVSFWASGLELSRIFLTFMILNENHLLLFDVYDPRLNLILPMYTPIQK